MDKVAAVALAVERCTQRFDLADAPQLALADAAEPLFTFDKRFVRAAAGVPARVVLPGTADA